MASRLGNGMAAQESCVTALYLGLAFLDKAFMEMLAFIARVKGDVDTIGAMAGAIWGAVQGAHKLPPDELQTLEQVERLESACLALFSTACGREG